MCPWHNHATNCIHITSIRGFSIPFPNFFIFWRENVTYILKMWFISLNKKQILLMLKTLAIYNFSISALSLFCKLNIFQKHIFNKTLYNKPENKHNSKLVTIWYLAFCYQSRREQCIAFEVWIIKPKKIKYQQFIHCGFEGEDMGWLKE